MKWNDTMIHDFPRNWRLEGYCRFPSLQGIHRGAATRGARVHSKEAGDRRCWGPGWWKKLHIDQGSCCFRKEKREGRAGSLDILAIKCTFYTFPVEAQGMIGWLDWATTILACSTVDQNTICHSCVYVYECVFEICKKNYHVRFHYIDIIQWWTQT